MNLYEFKTFDNVDNEEDNNNRAWFLPSDYSDDQISYRYISSISL